MSFSEVKGLGCALRMLWEVKPAYVVLNLLVLLFDIPARILTVLLVQFVIDAALGGSGFAPILEACLAYLAFQLVRYSTQDLLNHAYNPAAEDEARAKIQTKLHDQALSVDVALFDSKEFYDDFSNALSTLDERIVACFQNFKKSLGALASILTIIGVVSTLEPPLVLLTAACFILSMIANSLRSRMIARKSLASIPVKRRMQYINGLFYQNAFAKDMRVEYVGKMASDDFGIQTRALKELDRKFGRKIAGLSIARSAVNEMTDVAVYLYLGWGIVSGDLSAGSFTALMNASFTLLGQMSKLTTTLPDLSETSLLISDAMRFNDYKPTLAVADRGLPAKQSVTALAFQGVGFSYDGQTAALENISLEVRRGETLALVGHNGAGKTTIIKLLLRLYDPTRGTITLNSVPYEQYDLAKFRSMFAVAFQDYQLYAYTIAENVLMRRCESEGDEKLVYDALGKVGLAEKVRGLDEGIHTPVTKEFSTQGELFSGGEMQKLAIARALAKDAPVVILDEPSSALDPLSEREIADLISTLFTDKISIIVSHRLSTTMGASHIAVIDQGRVAERGTHSEFIAAQGTYARMREAQARGYCEPKERSRREAEGD